MDKKRHVINIFLLTAVLAASCVKEELLPESGTIGEGTAAVSFNIGYRPVSDTNLGKTKSAGGEIIRDIKEVFIAGYREDSTLAFSFYIPEEELSISTDKGTLPEKSDCRATFGCSIPYGRYRIYSAVNTGDLSNDARIQKEKDFRSIRFGWIEDNIAENDRMSGWFRLDNEYLVGRDAPLLSVSRPDVVLHSWVRRAASKVTVAIDASRLNENIYIYIKSAQILDIPSSCSLIDRNSPSSSGELLHEGDTIRFGNGDDYTKWPCLSCGRGANSLGSHADDAPSLFFFENMQGKDSKKHQYKNFESKDNKPYGTYIEVVGYYINQSADKPSYGNIRYRCMLGKNMSDDFNAERNTHYKLTLVFNKEANDIDWHIDYDYIPKPPEIVVPSPMIISYLSNQSLNIPVSIYFDEKLTDIDHVDITIFENDWSYSGHKYSYTNKQLYNGFLSLNMIDRNELSATERENLYMSSRTFSKSQLEETTDGKYFLEVPVYTRPMTMGNSFSGNNYYVGRRRYAKLRITAYLTKEVNGKKEITNEVTVEQSRRIVNPKGIWRKGESDKKFHVVIMNSGDDETPTIAEKFDTLKSHGPWTAMIIKGHDWVRIKDSRSSVWGTENVTGGTGSAIEFDYKPEGPTTEPRFGLIEVLFHNNTCSHMICVSQGMGTVEMDGVKWHMSNLEYGGKDTANPLMEGSMFAYGNSTDAILSSNNIRSGYGFDIDCMEKDFDVYNSDGSIGSIKLSKLRAKPLAEGFTKDNVVSDGGKCHVATKAEWEKLKNDKFSRYYGILYGDECSGSLGENTETNTYTAEGEEKGIRGCFVCDPTTGRHLFFPIGNTGYGHRKYVDDNNRASGVPVKYGVLKYAMRSSEMPVATAEAVPNYYSLWNEPGALYWYNVAVPKATEQHAGFDINYFSFGFESYTSNAVLQRNNSFTGNVSAWTSDLFFVRRVDN